MIEDLSSPDDLVDTDELDPTRSDPDDEEDDLDPEEFVHVDEKFYYLEYIIRALGITHAFVSLCMLIAYYNLKVSHRLDRFLVYCNHHRRTISGSSSTVQEREGSCQKTRVRRTVSGGAARR